MTERPLVAVTTSLNMKSGSHKQPSVFIYTSYIEVLEAIGLAPVLLTPAHSPDTIRSILGACRGLVLTGGEDVDPARYGELPSPALGSVLCERDDMEFAALDVALEVGMPVFAICRGLQVLNVHFGGTLYQDLPTEYPQSKLTHVQTAPWSTKAHSVRIEDDSLLCEIVGRDCIDINSFHNQAVKDVAPGLRVVARADDGLIEAVESRENGWILGVQWHPERHEATAPDIDPDKRLFAAFRDAVASSTATH
jgi:putative glutamine amidotransferase